MNILALVQTPIWAWWPVALIVAGAIFFAWWNDTYTKDKF